MCTNFEPFLDPSFLDLFGVALPDAEYKPEAFIQYLAPVVRSIIRKSETDPTGREAIAAHFGLIPYWFKPKPETPDKIVPHWATHNVRLETIGQLASFKQPWKRGKFCLIPVKAFYEPCWETGKAVRTRISLKSGAPFALAGIWDRWQRGDQVIESFSMITINADDHEIMKRMHRPGDEKRMPIILLPEDYDRWINADSELAFTMCQQFPADLMQAEDAPLVRKKKKESVESATTEIEQ
jgi:putative SOS response-associated peptidase YedK